MKKTYLAIGFVLLVVVGGVFAYQGDATIRNPFHSEERHQAMELAFETNDYSAWKTLMEESGKGDKKVLSVITEDNFDRFVEMHEVNENGDYETADLIRAELGLGLGEKGTACTGNSLVKAGESCGGDHSLEGTHEGCGMKDTDGEHNCGGCPYAN